MVAAIAPLIDVPYTFLQYASVEPISLLPCGIKLVVNTPNDSIVSPFAPSPNIILPSILTLFLKYAFDAVISPLKFNEPEFIPSSLAKVIGVVPNETCKEPDALCKYNSPSVKATEPDPLLI